MQVDVTYNEDHDGIELSFPEKPDSEVLSQIRSHGFRWHRRGKYWYARNSPTRKAFAESLSGQEISSDIPEPEPPDGPSYESTEENLEARNFSFVSINYVGVDGNSKGENYIIFEPKNFEAKYLAREFARNRHGPSFENVSIYPKNYIQKARTLFQLGRIIGAEPTEIDEDSKQDPEFPEELTSPSSPAPIQAENFSLLATLFPGLASDADWTTLYEPKTKLELSRLINFPGRFGLRPAERSDQMIEGALDLEIEIDLEAKTARVYQWAETAMVGLIELKFREDDSAYSEGGEYNQKLKQFLSDQIGKVGLKFPTDKPKPKRNARQLLNDQIEELIREKDRAGESYSVEDRELIIRYSGSGGLKIKGKDDRGVLYEYYTPDELVRYCWALAKKHGYSGGPVLEPACGTGNFLRYAPTDTLVTGYETNPVSARIAEILYPHAEIINRPFESAFFAGTVHLRDKFDLPRYELVIGNPPFGPFLSRYGGMGEKKFTGASRYEEYFIQRGLDLLAPGGLLLYVIHQSFLNSPKNKWKEKRLEPKIEAVRDAYRLPVGTFEHTDTVTDILILQKRI